MNHVETVRMERLRAMELHMLREALALWESKPGYVERFMKPKKGETESEVFRRTLALWNDKTTEARRLIYIADTYREEIRKINEGYFKR